MSAVRASARILAERLLGSAANVRRSLARRRGQAFIFTWHNIVPRGERAAGEHALHTDQAAFAEQLDAIADLLPVVRLRDLLGGVRGDDPPAAVLTFDDAYVGSLVGAGEELERRGLPATVFVAPAFLGGRTFWWDAFAAPDGTLAAPLRQRALSEWAGIDGQVRAGMAALGRSPADLPAHAAATDEDLLRRATASGLIDLASHTWSHPNLGALDPAARAAEIRRGDAWLTDRFPDAVRALALPYGLGAEHAGDAGAAGLRAALRIEGGWASPRAAPFQVLTRFNVPRGLTAGGLRLRLAGHRT